MSILLAPGVNPAPAASGMRWRAQQVLGVTAVAWGLAMPRAFVEMHDARRAASQPQWPFPREVFA